MQVLLFFAESELAKGIGLAGGRRSVAYGDDEIRVRLGGNVSAGLLSPHERILTMGLSTTAMRGGEAFL